MKTNKHLTLLLVSKRGSVHSRHIVEQFGYSRGTARSYLSYLGRQALLEHVGANYGLTEKGRNRLHYFDVFGCADLACPLCHGKAGYLTCPRCGHQVLKQEARILKERDYYFAVRHAGIYCDVCLKLILTESQAQLLGVVQEK